MCLCLYSACMSMYVRTESLHVGKFLIFQIPVWMLNIVLFGCDGSNDLKPAWMRMNRLWSDSTAFRLYSSLPFFIVVLFLKMWFHYLFSHGTGQTNAAQWLMPEIILDSCICFVLRLDCRKQHVGAFIQHAILCTFISHVCHYTVLWSGWCTRHCVRDEYGWGSQWIINEFYSEGTLLFDPQLSCWWMGYFVRSDMYGEELIRHINSWHNYLFSLKSLIVIIVICGGFEV